MTGDRQLAGLRVLVPRPAGQTARLADALAAAGAEPVVVPLVEIRPVGPGGLFDGAVDRLCTGAYDWVVLTSTNGVDALRGALTRRGLGPAALGHTRIAAVGPATAAALQAWGAPPDLVPADATGAALATALDPAGHGASSVADGPGPDGGDPDGGDPDGVGGDTGRSPAALRRGRVLLARADRAARDLPVILGRLGWVVDDVVAYHTVPRTDLTPAELARINAGPLHWVLFTSPSTVTGYLQVFGGPPPASTRVAVIGPVTGRAAADQGIRVDARAAEHTADGLVAAVVTSVRHHPTGTCPAAFPAQHRTNRTP